MFTTMAFIALALLEGVLTKKKLLTPGTCGNIEKTKVEIKKNKELKFCSNLHKICRFLFPLAFILFGAVYWNIVIRK